MTDSVKQSLKLAERRSCALLIGSLDSEPDHWSWRDADQDMLLNKTAGITIGTFYMTVYQPVKIKWGFWNRRRIRAAVRRWKSARGNSLAESERLRSHAAFQRTLNPMKIAA